MRHHRPSDPSSRPPQQPERPGTSEPGLSLFFRELKQRRVLHAAGLYLAGAFAVVQVIPFVFDAFGAGRVWWQVTLLVLVGGFPLTLVLAWLYELHPVSVKRERRLAPGVVASEAKRWAWAALAVILIAATAAAGTIVWQGRARGAPASTAAGPGPQHVAVLYFSYDSPDSTKRYVAPSITEALIPHLAQTTGLTVTSSAAVARFREKPVAPDSLARVLQVGMLITGVVTTAGDSLRAIVQLVDAASNKVVDSRSVDGVASRSRQFVNGVVREATVMLRERVGADVQERAWRAGTSSEQAWELVHRASDVAYNGNLLVNRGELPGAASAFRRADSLLSAAERADPAWNEPVVQRGWLAQRQWWLALVARDARERSAALERGIAHASRALRKHPDDAAASELRGVLRTFHARYAGTLPPPRAAEELLAAEADLGDALARDPHRARAWATLASARFARLDYRGALLDARHAFEEDEHALFLGMPPLEPLYTAYRSAFELNDDAGAREWCDQMQARDPGGAIPALCALQLMAWRADPPDLAAASALRSGAPGRAPPQFDAANLPSVELAYAAVLARAGLRDSAAAVIARARDPHNPDLLDREAEARVLLGQHRQAVALLEQYLRRYPERRPAIERSRRFVPLRTRPDFTRLFAEVGPER